MNIFKWWKDKTFMLIFTIALLSIVLAFITAYFISWGWILSIIIAIIGGYSMREILFNKLNEIANNKKLKYEEKKSR